MAPSATASQPMYQKDEKALCFHGELLYEAKVLEVRRQDSKDKTSPHEYRVHYKGWKNTWDDWVPQDRLRKLTDDNRELAANLKRELTQPPPRSAVKPTSSNKHRKGQGSDFGSGRGSEERHSSVPAGGRGTKRGRDNDVEKVGPILYSLTPRKRVKDSGASTFHGSRIEPPGSSVPLRQVSTSSGNASRRHSKTTTQETRSSRGRLLTKVVPFSVLDSDNSDTSPGSSTGGTVDDILAQFPPPDEPEYISKGTLQQSTQLFWAPLIGGTTMEEKAAIENELACAGMIEIPDRHHPKYIETRQEDPRNLHRMLFFECQDPQIKLSIAGTAKDPVHLDPPGCKTPFDALKYPGRLVEFLNRQHHNPLHGWNAEALMKIPPAVMAQAEPRTLASMPVSVLKSKRYSAVEQVQKALAARTSAVTSKTCVALGMKCRGFGEPCNFDKADDDESMTKESFSTNSKYLGLDLTDADTQYHLGKSAIDHLDLASATTRVLPKYYPKPTGGNLAGICKDCRRPRKPKNASIQELWDTSPAMDSPQDESSDNPLSDPNAYQNSHAQEENFHLRPSIRITIPDHLKNLLVDDWENVTKSLLLVPLPSKAPANFIIDTYFDEEKGSRRLGSAEADVLEEFCAGMKVYFEKSVGKILLYRFERGQLAEIRHLWESGKYPEWEHKGPGDAYGAEHLTRMLVNLPELIAQTNMDTQSVTRLREEITKFAQYLARNSSRFFCAKYEKPSAEYIENAR